MFSHPAALGAGRVPRGGPFPGTPSVDSLPPLPPLPPTHTHRPLPGLPLWVVRSQWWVVTTGDTALRGTGHQRGGLGRDRARKGVGAGRFGCGSHRTEERTNALGRGHGAGTDQEAHSPGVFGMVREKTPSNGPSLWEMKSVLGRTSPPPGFCPCRVSPSRPCEGGSRKQKQAPMQLLSSLEKSELSVTLFVVLWDRLYLFCKQTGQ